MEAVESVSSATENQLILQTLDKAGQNRTLAGKQFRYQPPGTPGHDIEIRALNHCAKGFTLQVLLLGSTLHTSSGQSCLLIHEIPVISPGCPATTCFLAFGMPLERKRIKSKPRRRSSDDQRFRKKCLARVGDRFP
jgi:hypothetical protein